MKLRWYQPVIIVVVLGFLGMSVLWGLSVQKSINVTPTSPTSPTSSVTSTPPEKNVKNNASPFSSAPSFEDARKKHPNAHPVVAMFKSMMDPYREELFSNPETKRVLEILESSEYAEFITTNPTIRETDEFWTEHGFRQDPDRFIKAFREEFPTGQPEDFEPEMRRKFAELFRDADLEKNAMKEISTRIPKFLDNPRNHAWTQGYFNRDGNLGDWAENILENLNDNLGEESDRKEPALTEASSINGLDMLPEANFAEKVDTLPDDKTGPDIVDGSRRLDNIRDRATSTKTLAPISSESIETFKGQFDPNRFSGERLDRAMDTLNRYGSQEGLDRLQDSDPELAREVEYLTPRHEEN